MFGGSKPTFGTGQPTTGFGGFSAGQTSSPFGQSAFGKPATTAFGAAPTFGTQQTTPSLFGSTAGQQQPTSNLFGSTASTSAFGATTSTQPAFGGFSQPQQNTSLFGATQNANTSLFGQSGASAFGSAVKPASLGGFGQTATQQPSLFGQTTPQTSTSGFGSFGQTAGATTNVFGSTGTSAFGQPAANTANAGTALAKYNPIVGTETLMKNGQQNNVNTKHHCITAMKEYEGKSLEELRMEDYLSNRKGGGAAAGGFFGSTTQPTTGTGLFGQTAQPSTGLFGQQATNTTENKGLFGSNTFGQNQNTMFGMGSQQQQQQQSGFGMKPFGSTTTGGFGTTTDNSNNLFGAKPAFGSTTAPSLFGQTSAASTAPAFGQTSGFGGFGSTAGTTQPSLFGATGGDANKPAFGLGATSTANTGFGGFGAPATSTAGGGLFDPKPNTGFGATPGFGTSTANTGFGGFGTSSGGLFNNSSLNKPPTSGFGGFGTAPTSTANLNFSSTNNQTSLFGNTGAKPTGIFGSTPLGGNNNTTGTGLFGGNNNQTSSFGSGLGLGSSLMGGTMMQQTLGAPQQATMPIHQQILSKVTSPYGDTGAFKDLQRKDDPTRATNPEAQKTIIDSTTAQFKINARSPGVLSVQPIGNNTLKKSLFEGLEEADSSVESFTLKPNPKRLIIKPKSNNNTPTRAAGLLNDEQGPEKDASNQDVLNNSLRNESFNGAIPSDINSNVKTSQVLNMAPSSSANKENDASRRESWLHPNNLEKVRQHNLNSGNENISPLDNTLTELMPRKPLETYRLPTAGSTRLSISTIPENPFEDQTNISHVGRRDTISRNENADDSLFGNRSYGTEERSLLEEPRIEYEEHPTGIKLTRIGYYTVPSLDDLKSYLAEDGSCVVPNFTIGRTGYGNVYFPKEIDVAGLNLDEIVHFRNKEITIYPDDENKPPVGSGLNREAQVTLDKVWPLDKTKQEPISDPVRLIEMDWEGRLRRVCDKNETRFVEFRPETGSWVFRVKHFSKYGLNDSDEEDVAPIDAKKAKMAAEAMTSIKNLENTALKNVEKLVTLKEKQKALDSVKGAAAAALDNDFYKMDESAEFMLMDKTKFFQQNSANNNSLMFEHQRYAQSPTTIMAKAAGTDPHKLQLMKASFFMDDDVQSVASDMDFEQDFNMNEKSSRLGITSQQCWVDSMPTKAISSGASSHVDFPPRRMSSSASALSRPTGAKSDMVLHEEKESVCKMPPFIITPKVAMVKTLSLQIPFVKSFASNFANKRIADLSIMNARKFKMNFGPRNTLIVPISKKYLTNSEIKNESLLLAGPKIFQTRRPDDFSPMVLQQIQLPSTEPCENFTESILGHLKIQLQNTVLEAVEGSECFYLHAKNGCDLIDQHKEESLNLPNRGKFEEYSSSVWSLCSALWGYHEELENKPPNSHTVVMFRRELLSEWLENTLTDKDLLTKTISNNLYLDHLWDLILCHKISEASKLAFNYEDRILSGLIAQMSSGPIIRRFAEAQLSKWNEYKADKFIDVSRLKIIMFIAGISLMSSSHGPINIMDDLDWINAFAVQLWYLCSPTLSITDSLLAYCETFEAQEFYSQAPTPPYFREYNAKQDQRTVYDTRFHLLKLFSKRSHPLESLLNPATHTPDPLDYRLSWLLLETLEALGYTHCSDLCEAQLHVGFAAQLEGYGLWEWAIFVLLHIKQRNQREIAVQNLLYRYVTITKDATLTEKEKFIIESFGVPEKWIDYAKSVKASSHKNYHLQVKYLLKAKQWNLAHEIIFQHITPDAVINNNLDYLRDLLEQFENLDLKKSVKVANWSNQGQILLDFIDIKEKFNNLRNLKNKDDIETHFENMKPCLSELCSRINLFPCPTAKHRLCQSEIAQNLAALVRGVLLMCPELDPCSTIQLALKRLPLPQEFAQQELRALLDMLIQKLGRNDGPQENEEPLLIYN